MRCGSEEQLHLRCRKAPDHNTLVFGSFKIATVEGSCIKKKTHTPETGNIRHGVLRSPRFFILYLFKKKQLTLKHIKANTSNTYKSYTQYFLIDIKAFFLHTQELETTEVQKYQKHNSNVSAARRHGKHWLERSSAITSEK